MTNQELLDYAARTHIRQLGPQNLAAMRAYYEGRALEGNRIPKALDTILAGDRHYPPAIGPAVRQRIVDLFLAVLSNASGQRAVACRAILADLGVVVGAGSAEIRLR